MKTTIEFLGDDAAHGMFKKGEKGYIDGYVQGGYEVPYAVIVIGERTVLSPIYGAYKVLGILPTNE